MTHTIYYFFFFFNDTPTTEIYTLSLHDALPISSKRGIVSRGVAVIDVPVSVGKRMLLGAGGDHVQQEFEAVVRLDAAEIGAVRAELAKEGLVICGDSLADDGDSEARHGRRLWRHSCAQTIGVSERGGSKSIHLMGGPEMRGELFHKLAGGIDPIEIFELGGKTDLREAAQPVLDLF